MSAYAKPIITKSKEDNFIRMDFTKTTEKPSISYDDSKILEKIIKQIENDLKKTVNLTKSAKALFNYKIGTFSEIYNLECEKTKNFLLSTNHIDIMNLLPISRLNECPTNYELSRKDLAFKKISQSSNLPTSEAEWAKKIEETAKDISLEDARIEYLNQNRKDMAFKEFFKAHKPPLTKDEESEQMILDYVGTLDNLSEVGNNIYELDDKRLEAHYKRVIAKLDDEQKLTKNALSFLKKILYETESSKGLPTSNQLFKAINNKQTGRLEELDRKDQDARALLKQKILEDPHLSEDEKNSTIEKVNDPSTNALFELDRYLGGKLDLEVNIVLRAVRAIVFEAIQSRTVESHHHPIKFQTHKLHELCGVTKHTKGGGHPDQIKKIISILTRSSLTEKILVKDEFNNVIKSTSFLLEVTFHRTKATIKEDRKGHELPQSITQEQCTYITVKVSDFLFANHINQLDKSYIQDVNGYIRFRKLNKTTIGNDLFLWLEIYLSIKDKIKELNLTTIIEALRITKRYKHSPKEVKNDIERALKEMIEANALIKDYKLARGTRGQEKYVFTNARYSENPKLEVVKTENKNSTKSKNKRKKNNL